MFKLFKKTGYIPTYPIKKYSKFDYIKRRYKSDLNKLKSYYRDKDRKVNNSHILNRLITILEPSGKLDIFNYLKYVEASAVYVSKQFNITSNINKGNVMDNEIMGIGSKEILIYQENDFDITTFKDDWITHSPLRVISTRNTNLDFRIPNNEKVYSLITELNVISIDIIVMMLQYYYWKIERINNDFSTNPAVFVSQVVLPNMLDNIIDMAIWNRFINIANGIPNDNFTINHPFIITDYSKGIDNILNNIYKDIYNSGMRIDNMLLQIPGIVGDNMLNTLNTGITYTTKQSTWVLWISRLLTISDIITILSKKDLRNNKDMLTVLPVTIKTMNRSSSIETMKNIDNLISENISMAIDNIKYTIGVR